jgi:allantoicase
MSDARPPSSPTASPTPNSTLTPRAFTDRVDLAQERLGGAVLYANDDFFASKDNLLKASIPIWLEGKYTGRGKWMDGWESRRRRTPGHDFCLVRLGAPGIVRGVVVDTAFFKGNYPEHCSIDACSMRGQPTPEELLSEATTWTEILSKTALVGDGINAFEIADAHRFTHLRLHIYPDGGVARLRVYGDVTPDPRWMGRAGGGAEVDLASVENGGVVVACNDMFFGSRHNLVMPGRSVNMGDGWETKRSRRAGPDWVVLKLGAPGTIARIEVDTNHFKGNYPESCALFVRHVVEGAGSSNDELATSEGWTEILPRTKLQPHTRHFYDHEIAHHGPATHVKMHIFPDGGVSRLRLWGTVSREGREHVGIAHLDASTEGDAIAELLACCGSRAWARGVARRAPFGSLASLKSASDDVWRALGPDDYREAFLSHPRIGERKAQVEHAHGARSSQWAEHEQAKVADAEHATLDAIGKANAEYEAKFGHIFLICATGKSGGEILASLRARITNDADAELRIAAEEQRKITHLRLEKLVQR